MIPTHIGRAIFFSQFTNSKANLFWKHHQRHTRSCALLAPWVLNKDMRKINSYSLSQTGLQEQLPKTHSQSLFFTHTVCPARLAGLWSLGEPG